MSVQFPPPISSISSSSDPGLPKEQPPAPPVVKEEAAQPVQEFPKYDIGRKTMSFHGHPYVKELQRQLEPDSPEDKK